MISLIVAPTCRKDFSLLRLSPLILCLVGCSQQAPAQPANGQVPITGARPPAAKPFVATEVARFDSPWSMAFLPDGRMLVTEKAGRLKLVSADGRTSVDVAGVPKVDSEGQGGLMDVVLAPDFARMRPPAANDVTLSRMLEPGAHIVYLSWSEAGPGGKGLALGRGLLVERQVQCVRAPCPAQARIEGFETIFRARPFVAGSGHYSGRIAFSPDGYLFFTNGERQKFTPAQDPQATLGKVLRLTAGGRPAPGNPLTAKGFAPEIWSYGHRNLLGIALDASGKLWEVEMGPRGGDELNLVQRGRNYGWPIVSNGNHYDGRDIPDHRTRPEFEAPKVSWNPVISPSSLAIYSGAMFPAWRGNALIGGLSSKSLVRVVFEGTGAREAERYDMGARIRAVTQAPDGSVYLLEDEGRMLRLTPRAAPQ